MQEIKLKVDPREVQGKKVSKLRENGLIPSVVYGHGDDPINTQSEALETIRIVKEAGRHSAINLTVDGKKKLVIIKNLDIDPVKHNLRHISFQAISQDEEISTEVSIHLDGITESPAERAGLVVLQAIEHIEIKAKPSNLPEALHVSILNLETTDDKLTLSDIKLPEGVSFADQEVDMSLVVTNVYEPSALQAANEAAAGDAEAEDAVDVDSEEGEASEDGESETDSDDKKESEDTKSDKDQKQSQS